MQVAKTGKTVPRTIPAGVLDAGFNSLATFAVGLFAARFLQPTTLGAYALAFSAFLLMTNVPTRLLFNPAEIAAVGVPESSRLGLLRQTLKLGVLPALLAAASVSIWMVVAPSTVPSDVTLALTVTAVTCAFVSPIQNHVRRMLHLGGASWRAAVVSGAQFVGVVAAIAALAGAGVAAWWVPFGALALANIASLSLGWLLSPYRGSEDALYPCLRFTELVRSGRWLLIVGLLQPATTFVSAALVSHLAGAQALGYAEAARILGHPPAVLALGLTAVLGPRSIEAAQRRQLRTARHISRVFAGLMLGLGLPYLVLFGFGWDWNPVSSLLPNAYVVGGLVAATVLSDILHGMQWPYQSELMGARKEVTLAKIEVASNAVRLGIAGTAGVIGPFALPAGFVALRAVRSLGYRAALRTVYHGSEAQAHQGRAAGQMGSETSFAVAARDGSPST